MRRYSQPTSSNHTSPSTPIRPIQRHHSTNLLKRIGYDELATFCPNLIHQATFVLHKQLVTMPNRTVLEGGIK